MNNLTGIAGIGATVAISSGHLVATSTYTGEAATQPRIQAVGVPGSIAVSALDPFYLRVEVKHSRGLPMHMRAWFMLDDGTHVSYLTSDTVTNTSDWTDIEIGGNVPATASRMGYQIIVSSNLAESLIGDVIEARNMTTDAGDYLDGTTGAAPGFATAWEGAADASPSYTYDMDFTPSWVGTPNASASITTANRSATANVTVMPIQSVHWALEGSYSLRMSPRWATPGSGYITIDGLGGSLQRGREYTVIVTVRKDTLSLANRGGLVYAGQEAGTSQTVYAPNEPGVYEIRMVFKVGMTGTANLRLIHGGALGEPDIWFDGLTIVEGRYGGGFFDGNTMTTGIEEYMWLDQPDASASVMYLPATNPGAGNYCDVNWHSLKDQECYDRLFNALEETVEYEAENIVEEAPWASDASGYTYIASPARKFLGVYGLSVSALSDSSRSVDITEGILSGGVLGRGRRSDTRRTPA